MFVENEGAEHCRCLGPEQSLVPELTIAMQMRRWIQLDADAMTENFLVYFAWYIADNINCRIRPRFKLNILCSQPVCSVGICQSSVREGKSELTRHDWTQSSARLTRKVNDRSVLYQD